MKFSIKDFFSKCDQIRWSRRIWSHLLQTSLMENFIFCAVCVAHETLTFLNPHIFLSQKFQSENLKPKRWSK